MQYFYNLSSASGGKSTQTPTGALSLDPLGYFCPQIPNLPTPAKILRAYVIIIIHCRPVTSAVFVGGHLDETVDTVTGLHAWL